MDIETTAPVIKKHIRTLAGDMEILQTQSPSERLVAPSPIAPVTIVVPPTPPLESVPEPPIPPPKLSKPSPIETYEGDFLSRMKGTNASPVTVLAAEQDTGRQTFQTEKKSQSGIIFLFAGLVLLVIGGFGVYFAYTYYISEITTDIFVPFVSAPIFVDESEEISGTGNALLVEIKKSISKPLASGAVRFLYTANATTTSNSVFSALQLPAPNILLRNINAKDSMAGIVNTDDPSNSFGTNSQSPFFILSVASYSNTFSGMLVWEKTMPKNLIQLFPSFAESFGGQASSTVATTTTSTATSSAPIITAGFKDEIVNNHDVRVYRDSSGRSVLLYGYWNQTTLVIARDPKAFSEILGRLANSRIQ